MIVAGIGFRTSATPRSLQRAFEIACETAQITQVDVLASAAAKLQSPVLQAFAAYKSLPLLAVDVAGVDTPTQSTRVQAIFGTGSLAEAAALVSAGPDAQLICPRITSPCGRVTMAIAQSQDTK
jgi:cobalt-precorrin 5A hydrolase